MEVRQQRSQGRTAPQLLAPHERLLLQLRADELLLAAVVHADQPAHVELLQLRRAPGVSVEVDEARRREADDEVEGQVQESQPPRPCKRHGGDLGEAVVSEINVLQARAVGEQRELDDVVEAQHQSCEADTAGEAAGEHRELVVVGDELLEAGHSAEGLRERLLQLVVFQMQALQLAESLEIVEIPHEVGYEDEVVHGDVEEREIGDIESFDGEVDEGHVRKDERVGFVRSDHVPELLHQVLRVADHNLRRNPIRVHGHEVVRVRPDLPQALHPAELQGKLADRAAEERDSLQLSEHLELFGEVLERVGVEEDVPEVGQHGDARRDVVDEVVVQPQLRQSPSLFGASRRSAGRS
eukprot:279956-Hanusia_phi.AAC.3